MSNYIDILNNAYNAKNALASTPEELRVKAMESMSNALKENVDLILEANKLDLDKASNILPVMKKRLSLTKEKIFKIADDIIEVSKLESVTNEVLEEIKRPNGLLIKKVSVPFGVILAIFESRPNVCVDIASLCIKTSNVCLLRGGKEALNTNMCLVKIIRESIKEYIPEDSVCLIDDTNREIVSELIKRKDKIDLVVPRGGKGLIDFICNNSLVPVIETGAGTCHIYVDDKADLDMAISILKNAKMSNPAVCNACECALINTNIKDEFFKKLKESKFLDEVVVHGDEITNKYLNTDLVKSYYTEFNDLEINFKVVDNIKEAINHINTYGTKHSEVIVTNNMDNADLFMKSIDAACIYLNASSRFSDGGCFGFGAELGISTGKMHARGPMGLKEMMTYKYLIYGNGQIRK